MAEQRLEREVVAFATDSIATIREIPGLNSTRLGEMKLDKQADDVIFLSNGFYCFNGKWKQREIGYDHEKGQRYNIWTPASAKTASHTYR
jgi:hypothetical protein